ncbi:MAG: hypothetical protein EP299_06545 [Acidobacteria bacterium]|nr:MAG: hypothetical protein EP299_06545 [Acidobacteriota bacterium]
MTEDSRATRRDLLASFLMGGGLVLAYGTLALQGILFLLPKRLRPKTRLIFAGRIDQFTVGAVTTIHDLDGNAILVKRGETGFEAFSSVCPHLGCRVHWEAAEETSPAMAQKYEAKVEALLTQPEHVWLKGLSPEEAEALRQMYA